MKIIFCLFLTCSAANLFAQQQPKVIYRDTINLRGYIFNDQGKPMKYLYIESTQLDPQYNLFKVGAYTDTSGFFELKGAKFNDTLKFQGHATYFTPDCYNRDSRYMVIYLPEKIVDGNSSKPVEIKHKREYPQITPKLNIKSFYATRDFFEVHKPAEFSRGATAFEDFIKRNVTYPESAVKNNAEGTVQISFTVEKDGSPANFKILRGIGYGCDQEVINILKMSPKWRPAIDNGRPLTMKQTVSVKFSLTDN
jgi:TonB family protein